MWPTDHSLAPTHQLDWLPVASTESLRLFFWSLIFTSSLVGVDHNVTISTSYPQVYKYPAPRGIWCTSWRPLQFEWPLGRTRSWLTLWKREINREWVVKWALKEQMDPVAQPGSKTEETDTNHDTQVPMTHKPRGNLLYSTTALHYCWCLYYCHCLFMPFQCFIFWWCVYFVYSRKREEIMKWKFWSLLTGWCWI